MEFLNFDEYFYEVWDYVPFEVVSNRVYERNIEAIREMTFGLWEIYKNTLKVDDFGFMNSEMSTERAAKILTKVFESVNKMGLRV